MASTASIPIGASTSGHVLVQSVSRQTLQLFVGNNRFRCYIHQFGILGHIRGGFRRSRDDRWRVLQVFLQEPVPLATYWCSRYPVGPSSYLLVIFVFVAIQTNLEYQVIFEVDLEGQGRSMARILQVFLQEPVPLATYWCSRYPVGPLQLFVCNNRFRLLYIPIWNNGFYSRLIQKVKDDRWRVLQYSCKSQYLQPRTGVVGIPSDPPVICW